MKRILPLFLVGILLLPSLFACGIQPQATDTKTGESPTAPAVTEIPAIEIGKSWASMEGMEVQAFSKAWTKDESWIGLSVTWEGLSCAEKMRSSPIYLQEKINGIWQNAFSDASAVPTPLLGHVIDGHCFVLLTGFYDCFENGTYRLFIEIPKALNGEFWITDEEAWQEFTVTGMPTAKAEYPIPFEMQVVSVGGPDWDLIPPTYGQFDTFTNRTELLEFLSDRTSRSPEDLGYDDAFFEDHFLVAALFMGGNSGQRNTVDYVSLRSDGKLCISTRELPYSISSDLVVVLTRLFIALPKEIATGNKEDVVLCFNYSGRGNTILDENLKLLQEYIKKQ